MLSAVPFLGQVAVEDKELRIKRKETRPFYFLTSFVFLAAGILRIAYLEASFFVGFFLA